MSTSHAAALIRRQRLALHLSQPDLAGLACLSPTTVTRAENDHPSISPDVFRRLREVLQQARQAARTSAPDPDELTPERLRARRNVLGVTIDELADKAGLSPGAVLRAETGQSQQTGPAPKRPFAGRPKAATLEKLAEALNELAQPGARGWTGKDYRDERKRLGLTVEQVAKATGLSPDTVSQLERGTRRPHPGTRKTLRAHLEEYGKTMPSGTIRERRERLRLTQRELAKRARVNRLTLIALEKGRSCRVHVRRKILDTLTKLERQPDARVRIEGWPHATAEEIGAEVRGKRRAAGMAIEELANRVGASFTAIYLLEEGITRGSAKLIDRIERSLLPGAQQAGARLYPKQVAAAKRRCQSTGEPERPSQRGRRRSQETWDVYRFCYEARMGGDKRAAVMKKANEHFGRTVVSEEKHVTLYVKRYALDHNPPLSLDFPV